MILSDYIHSRPWSLKGLGRSAVDPKPMSLGTRTKVSMFSFHLVRLAVLVADQQGDVALL